MQLYDNGQDIILCQVPAFDLAQTLDCGQAFRWQQQPDGSFAGVAGGRRLHISAVGQDITLHNTTRQEYEAFWRHYFDLDRDYEAVQRQLSAHPVLRQAIAFCPGLRILNQEPWEALCSFIISQNNNIARIKGIVARLCESFGESLGEGWYAFPTAQRLAVLDVEDLAPLRCGFRARYILDAARRVAGGEIVLENLPALQMAEAQAVLCRILGVGEKVAQCAMLFGQGRVECFPRDVWIQRACRSFFPDGLPEYVLPYAGIAQQHLFEFMRRQQVVEV